MVQVQPRLCHGALNSGCQTLLASCWNASATLARPIYPVTNGIVACVIECRAFSAHCVALTSRKANFLKMNYEVFGAGVRIPSQVR